MSDDETKSFPPELKKQVPISNYRYMKTCTEQFEKLCDWLMEHMDHQIGMGDLVSGESAVDMVIRLLKPMAHRGYLGHTALIVDADDGVVIVDGSLWDARSNIVTQGTSIAEALKNLKDCFYLYEEVIAKKFGSEALTGLREPEAASAADHLTKWAEILEMQLQRSGQPGLIEVLSGITGLVVYLARGTAEYEGPWKFPTDDGHLLPVTVEYVDQDSELVEEVTH